MFARAREKAPTIVFIDEINELVPDRNSDVHEMTKGAVNEMLAQMDRTGEDGIFIIGATNLPLQLDPAILRAGRLEKKYYIGPPDKEAREALFRLFLKVRPFELGMDYVRLADLTENYVSADISLIVNDAARKALKSKSKITLSILEETIRATRPSLSLETIAQYERMREKIEGGSSSDNANVTNERKRIGFK